MKRKIEVEVEPLSESRWAKIDERVFAALDEGVRAEEPAPVRHTRWYVAGGALAAAAAALLVWRVTLPPRDTFVHDPSHVETAAVGSRLALGYATLEVEPNSAITTSGDDAHGMLVVLEHGVVDCEVAPRAGRPPFVVAAGDVRVKVVGTRFVVRREADGVRVEVKHGRVEVARGSDVVLIADGESWPPAPAPSATTSATEPTPSTTTSATATTVIPTPSAKPRPTDQQLYESAAKLEARDPDAAIASYTKLANGGGPWAPTALFAAGRLAAERGQSARARTLLESYLSRYPSGANAADARRLLAGLP